MEPFQSNHKNFIASTHMAMGEPVSWPSKHIDTHPDMSLTVCRITVWQPCRLGGASGALFARGTLGLIPLVAVAPSAGSSAA